MRQPPPKLPARKLAGCKEGGSGASYPQATLWLGHPGAQGGGGQIKAACPDLARGRRGHRANHSEERGEAAARRRVAT
jgi:hypothetical protein